MNRDETTWFGINLTQKQATSLFVLSIAGIFITFFIIIQMFTPLLFIFMGPYYAGSLIYFFQTMLMMAPYIIACLIGLILSIYTLRRSRKIARRA